MALMIVLVLALRKTLRLNFVLGLLCVAEGSHRSLQRGHPIQQPINCGNRFVQSVSFMIQHSRPFQYVDCEPLEFLPTIRAK